MIEKLRKRFREELEALDLELDEEVVAQALKAYLGRRLRRRERVENMTAAEVREYRRRRRNEKRRERARDRRARALDPVAPPL